MLNEFSRTELLIGKEAMQRLYNARVAVFGIGGVGGYVVEALARSGVGAFDLIDDDKVCLTNINRQIIATRKTIGKYKVDVMEEYGSRQQIRPHAVPCGGYLQDYHVPFGEGHAQRTQKARCEEAEGGVFYGKSGEAAGKYGKQLQDRLCLSSGYHS